MDILVQPFNFNRMVAVPQKAFWILCTLYRRYLRGQQLTTEITLRSHRGTPFHTLYVLGVEILHCRMLICYIAHVTPRPQPKFWVSILGLQECQSNTYQQYLLITASESSSNALNTAREMNSPRY